MGRRSGPSCEAGVASGPAFSLLFAVLCCNRFDSLLLACCSSPSSHGLLLSPAKASRRHELRATRPPSRPPLLGGRIGG